MATFRILEDIENRVPEFTQKSTANVPMPKKRAVLGVLDNQVITAINNKQNIVNKCKPANDDSNVVAAKPTNKLPAPVIPVAQFKAFKVYEDSQNENDENDVVTSVMDISIIPTPDKSVVLETPMSEGSVPATTPSSMDKSLVENKDPVIAKSKSDREAFFENTEYQMEIFRYLLDAELRHRPKAGYMKKQPDITHSMRTILVDWLVEVGEEYRLQTETLYLAISYIDRFLSYMSVVRAKLQLVGTAAMFIASKFEEIYPPDVGEFVYITDDTYSKKQVLRMEQLILKVLSFDVSIPTPLTFISAICIGNQLPEQTMFLSMYIVELSMLEVDPYLQYLPSELAASAVAIARFTLDEEPWPTTLKNKVGYSLTQLETVINYLLATFKGASALSQQAIQEKYKASKFLNVSSIPVRNEPFPHPPVE